MRCLDLAIIDGRHVPDQLRSDVSAVLPLTSSSAVVVCHDVGLLGMRNAFEALEVAPGWRSSLLDMTTSGCGVLWKVGDDDLGALLLRYSLPDDIRARLRGDAARRSVGSASTQRERVIAHLQGECQINGVSGVA